MSDIIQEMGEMVFDIKEKITDNEYLALYNKLRDVKELLECEAEHFWDPPPEQSEEDVDAEARRLWARHLVEVGSSIRSFGTLSDDRWPDVSISDIVRLNAMSPEELVADGPRHPGGPVYYALGIRDLLRNDRRLNSFAQPRPCQAHMLRLLEEPQTELNRLALLRGSRNYLRMRQLFGLCEPSDSDPERDEPAV